MLADDPVGELEHLCSSRGIKRGGVLIEQQQLRRLQRRH